ncbi:MAG: hypothetical protein ACXWK7_19020 [Caulobacteraceae bacterium]
MAAKSMSDREKSRSLGKALKSMFRSLEKRPVPERLKSVADQLAEIPGAALDKKTG